MIKKFRTLEQNSGMRGTPEKLLWRLQWINSTKDFLCNV